MRQRFVNSGRERDAMREHDASASVRQLAPFVRSEPRPESTPSGTRASFER